MGKPPCCDKNGLKKGPWTAEEDQKLINYIQIHGHGRWRLLPKNAGLQRCGKSCRLRWTNYLRPDIKRGTFSFEEEETIIQLHRILGNKWSMIAARLPGRTDNEIKNYWNTHIRKRLLRMGIDPVTHGPRLDLHELSSILGSSIYMSASPEINFPSLNDLIRSSSNPNLVNLANALLSSHCKIPEFLPQIHDHHQNPLIGNLQIQDPVQEIQACTTSNETQFMQATAAQFCSNPNSTFTCQSSMPIMCQTNGEGSNSAESFSFLPNYGNNNYELRDQPNVELMFIRNQMDHNSSNNSNVQNLGFGSVISTPASSSSTPLNSPSTTYVNGGTEDERDSYCSNILMFNTPTGLDVNGFM